MSVRDRLLEGSTDTGQIKQILFTGQVSDTVITSVNCNHIQSTKEMTINGVYSFLFFIMHDFVYMAIFLSVKMVLNRIYCFVSYIFHIEVYC